MGSASRWACSSERSSLGAGRRVFDVTRASLDTVSSECWGYCGVETPGSGECSETCYAVSEVSLYLSKRVVTCYVRVGHPDTRVIRTYTGPTADWLVDDSHGEAFF